MRCMIRTAQSVLHMDAETLIERPDRTTETDVDAKQELLMAKGKHIFRPRPLRGCRSPNTESLQEYASRLSECITDGGCKQGLSCITHACHLRQIETKEPI